MSFVGGHPSRRDLAALCLHRGAGEDDRGVWLPTTGHRSPKFCTFGNRISPTHGRGGPGVRSPESADPEGRPCRIVSVVFFVREWYHRRVASRTRSLFAHVPYPLMDTLDYQGDPGLFGPDSVTWTVMGDPATFVGGIRALLIQSAHPEVVAGVADHSRYEDDPLGRLSRTSAYVTATAYGAMPEVERAIDVVRRTHRPIKGVSHRGRPYTADDPPLSAWVHNTLTDSFLVSHQTYGPEPLTVDDADRFVAEQTRVGALLDTDPMPDTAEALASWLIDHLDVASSPGMKEAMIFLRSPPLSPGVKIAYRILYQAAVATIPTRLRRVLGVHRHLGARTIGRLLIRFLRWTLGGSPSWQLALIRVGAEVPDGRFLTEPVIPPPGWAPRQGE